MSKKSLKPNSPDKTGLLNNTIRRIAFTFVMIFLCLGVYALLSPTSIKKEVPLSDVIARANDENGDIKKITVLGQNLEITLKDKDQPTQISRKDASGTLYEQGLINHCADLSGDQYTGCPRRRWPGAWR